jgi:hypothetical protein
MLSCVPRSKAGVKPCRALYHLLIQRQWPLRHPPGQLVCSHHSTDFSLLPYSYELHPSKIYEPQRFQHEISCHGVPRSSPAGTLYDRQLAASCDNSPIALRNLQSRVPQIGALLRKAATVSAQAAYTHYPSIAMSTRIHTPILDTFGTEGSTFRTGDYGQRVAHCPTKPRGAFTSQR